MFKFLLEFLYGDELLDIYNLVSYVEVKIGQEKVVKVYVDWLQCEVNVKCLNLKVYGGDVVVVVDIMGFVFYGLKVG